MEIREFFEALEKQEETGNSFIISLNSQNLEENSGRNAGVELMNMFFTDSKLLCDNKLLCFSNMHRKPIGKTEEGIDVYPIDADSEIFIKTGKIAAIENVEDYENWFQVPCSKVVNLYMLQENDTASGHRNVVTIGFLKWIVR